MHQNTVTRQEYKKVVQNYKFPKFSGASNKIATAGLTSESCRTMEIPQNMSSRYKLKVATAQPTPVYTV